MAKKQTPNKPADKPSTKPLSAEPIATVEKPKFIRPASLLDYKVQAIIVAILAFILYANTYMNEYAHDDGITIIKNEYVQEGFAGIPSIFKKDAYDSYYKQLNTVNQLAGGRYRPLSMVTFAIEQQFFGAVPEEKVDSYLKQNFTYGIRGPAEQKLVSNMHIRHLFNVFWYMGCVLVLLYFLRYIIFPNQPIVALVAAILFTAHPIHTEVIANVKSRDEIMSLLFIGLTFILAFKYVDTFVKNAPKYAADNDMLLFGIPLTPNYYDDAPFRVQTKHRWYYLGGAMLALFFAFLSKEYAITALVLLPFSLMIFRRFSLFDGIKLILPFVLVFMVYFYMRLQAANTGETENTITDMIGGLFKGNENSDKEVLNNPYYFCKDNMEKRATQIATSLNYIKLLLVPYPLSADYSFNTIPYEQFSSLKVWLSILVHLGITVIGLVFAFSKQNIKHIISFAIAFYMLHLLMVNNLIFNIGATMGERLVFHSSLGFAIVMAMGLCWLANKMSGSSGKMILMGMVSIITIGYAAVVIPRNMDWKNDKTLFFKDIEQAPNSVLVLGNVAASYITMADMDTVIKTKHEKLHKAIGYLSHAIDIHPTFVAGYLNKGIAYLKLGDIDSAQLCIANVKKYYPNYPTLGSIYALIADTHMKNGWNKYGKFGKYPEAIAEFRKGLEVDPNNAELWYNVGGAYYSNHQYKEAVEAWQHTLQIKPNYVEAQQGMQAAISQMQGGTQPLISK